MPLSESPVSNRGYEISKNNRPATAVSLNDVFRESMKRVQARPGQPDVIVRCESLPFIRTSKDEMIAVFESLITMIFNHPATASKLFLYIDCEESKESQPLSEEKGEWKYFVIRFYTNITTDKGWMDTNEAVLEKCRQVVASQQGTLVVNSIVNTGCLYTILLPGKPQ
ncbi:MAG TPA: hypothetical protein VFR58_11785 [Flavisolibacter sp.]|nr:hypothetical protein [Flavisolibacter sp.]